ncbi:hypothetical protein VOLCADRAFT_89855 [Volvox carteri f. nagariensis]|uniref:Pherophorin domain-containing protein n=1 Tax=Volvox carteri f. nagariensis TaxID=3068 RepID=D8TSU3_VOLCA|nr:uncharacterized protein VOLCADRAFT_89855 [Volvox carteri f. nagariensis]EFJ49437.1 hypothetical protein VOLCADRAFT_89855 [Volvox carteri f. nagariensis]|eukprot:XP_002949418.1 hypothetical protein VOLCADRAFT_89855 [Volvox carteri f. nagariensis]
MPPLASCGPTTVLYREGVPVSAIRTPVKSADTGEEVSTGYILQVFDLPSDQAMGFGYHLDGTPNIVVRWEYSLPSYYLSYGILSEADFNAKYNGLPGCTAPANLTDFRETLKYNVAFTRIGDQLFFPIFEACQCKSPTTISTSATTTKSASQGPVSAPAGSEEPQAPKSTKLPQSSQSAQLTKSAQAPQGSQGTAALSATPSRVRDTYLRPPYQVVSPTGPLNATATHATYCFRLIATTQGANSSSCTGMKINRLEFIVTGLNRGARAFAGTILLA